MPDAGDPELKLMQHVIAPAADEIETEGDQFALLQYAVRVGVHGQVGRFGSSGERFSRSAKVICRTARGLEIGTVLNRLERPIGTTTGGSNDGQILRRMTAEDQLLWNNLQHLAAESHAACQAWLSTSNSPDRLLEVEPLFDGRTLYFHFLNSARPETDAHLERLVAIFQETVAASAFSHLLEHGCGPGCGTAAAVRGCGSSCQTCSASKGCAVKRVSR